jgi:hypothetical protein
MIEHNLKEKEQKVFQEAGIKKMYYKNKKFKMTKKVLN